MANVFDVARYILDQKGQITTVKLQKLVYYCQAWSLVWDEQPLFNESIQAWANGPVVPALFNIHKGLYYISPSDIPNGNPNNLSITQKETINSIIKHYGGKSAQWLVDLTHLENPWKDARSGCDCGEACSNEITHASMMDYYSSL